MSSLAVGMTQGGRSSSTALLFNWKLLVFATSTSTNQVPLVKKGGATMHELFVNAIKLVIPATGSPGSKSLRTRSLAAPLVVVRSSLHPSRGWPPGFVAGIKTL